MNEIQRKLFNNIPLTEKEVNLFLTAVCDELRHISNIYDPMDSDCKVCDETSMNFGRLMLIKYGCDTKRIDIKKELQIPLTHYANIIDFNLNGQKKTYLIDMTYSQFFGDNIVLDDIGKRKGNTVTVENTFGKIKDELFVQKLRKYGFIELNDNILKQYIDTFLDLCEIKNKKTAYENIKNLLNDTNLSVKQK